jgi:protein MPE1
MMTLQNPQLAPPMRMQLSMQAQMLNTNLQQMQMMATSTMGMQGGDMMANANGQGMVNGYQPGGYGGGMANNFQAGRRGGGGPQFQHRQQAQANRNSPYERTAPPRRGRGLPTAPVNKHARY